MDSFRAAGRDFLPFRFKMVERHALVVVADKTGIDESTEVQLFGIKDV